MTLARPIAGAVPVPLPVGRPALDRLTRIRVAAFYADEDGGETPWVASGHVLDKRARRYPPFAYADGLVLHDVDTARMSSGALVFGRFDGR